MLQDPELRGVGAILFDEFHERHLYGDITLARALQLQETARPDLKLVVMSATLESGKLEKYLAPCPVLTSSGRTHPVTIEYLDKPVRAENYLIWDLVADELARLAPRTEGDALVFLPGKYEITRTLAAVRNSRVSAQFVALPLYSELPPQEQDAALARPTLTRATQGDRRPTAYLSLGFDDVAPTPPPAVSVPPGWLDGRGTIPASIAHPAEMPASGISGFAVSAPTARLRTAVRRPVAPHRRARLRRADTTIARSASCPRAPTS